MKTCPTCKSNKGLRKIAYGLPSSDLNQSIYVSGGCVISEYDPTLKCIECGWLGVYKSFQVPGFIASRLFEGQDTYWIIVNVQGTWLGGLYRYLHQDDSIFEQYWDRKEGTWNHTIRLSKMISGGECSLERITENNARQLLPEAFKE